MVSPTPVWGIHKFDTTASVAPIEAFFNTHADDLENALNSLNTKNAYPAYATLTALTAVPGTIVGQHASVNADSTVINNGDYRWSGTAWIQISADTGWITPTLGNSWTSVSTQTVQYRRLNGVVYMRGRATGGTTNTAFTLPAGYRPTTAALFAVLEGATTTTASRVVVNTDGTVQLVSGQNPNFAQVIFPADA